MHFMRTSLFRIAHAQQRMRKQNPMSFGIKELVKYRFKRQIHIQLVDLGSVRDQCLPAPSAFEIYENLSRIERKNKQLLFHQKRFI